MSSWKELDRRFKDVAKNLEYSSMVGCNTNDSPSQKKEKEQVICNHIAYGCVGTKEHKTERSQHCTFNGKSKDEIAVIWATCRVGEVAKGKWCSTVCSSTPSFPHGNNYNIGVRRCVTYGDVSGSMWWSDVKGRCRRDGVLMKEG